MIKKTTRFSYFLLVLLCMVYNVVRAQDSSSSGSPIILNSSQCNAYFSSASNVIDVTWWYNDPSTTPIDGSYQQITTSTMPYSGVNFSVSDPTRLDFYFSESYAPLRGKLIRLRRGLWIQGAQNAAFSYNYYVYPFDPSVNLSACNGIITASDASGNYAALPRIYELYKDGALVDTKSAASSTTFTVQSTGVYTVKIRVLTTQGRPGSSSHEYSDTENITIGSIPSVSPAVSVCHGQGAQIQATGGTSYAWSNGHTASQITVTPTTTTTYNVTITSSPTCQTPKSVTVTVNPLPSPVISNPPALVCKGETKTLTASGGVSYVWSSSSTSAMFSPANAASTNITPITSGTHTYTVNVTNSNGCSKSVSHTINTPAPPTINGSGDVCTGQAAMLTVSHGTSFLWSTGATTQSMSHVSGNANEIYTVTVTDANQCTHVINKLVVRTSNPSVNLGADRSVCPGVNNTITSNITGGTFPFEYAWSSGHSTGTINVSQTTATTYTLTVTDNKGCIGTDQVVLSMAPMPVANAGTDKTIAANNPVTLTASGSGGSPGYTYSWSNGGSNANTNVSPASTTTYTVTLTDTKGCTSTDQAVVTVIQPPTVNLGADRSLCLGIGHHGLSASVTNGKSPFTYAWSHGAQTAYTEVSPASTTTYTVTVTDAFGQTGTDNLIVTVNPNPIANAGIDKAVCISGSNISAELIGNATGGAAPYNYSWSNGVNNISTVVTPSQSSTTYTLTVTDSKNCTSVDQVVVTKTSPSVYAGADQIIDLGQTITLSAIVLTGGTAPFSYNWGGTSGASISVSPTAMTTYTVEVTDANGCVSTDGVVVDIRPNPTADAGANKTICAGSSTTLSVGVTGGLSPYTYAWSNGANTSTISVSPGSTTTYTVTVTDNNNRTGTDQVVVTVNPKPTASAGVDREICPDFNTLLSGTASGGTAPYTYNWSPGGTSASFYAYPSATTTYTLNVSDSKGCTASSQVIVTVNPRTIITSGNTQTICEGASAYMTRTVSGGTAPFTYAWSNGATTTSTTVSPSTTTYYNFTVTDSKGCYVWNSEFITVKAKPVVNAGADQSICAAANTNISGTASGGTAPYTYNWSSGQTTSSFTASPSVATTYVLSVTDNQGCTASDQVVITVNSNPSIDVGVNQTICAGTSTTLTGNASGGTAPYSYTWPGGTTTSSLTVSPTNSTTYTLTVTDYKGCSATGQVSVSVDANPSASAGANRDICNGASTTLTSSASGGTAPYNYTWLGGATTSSFTVSPTSSSTYFLTVTDSKGCSATSQVSVTVNTNPSASAGADKTICAGTNATLTGSASGGTTPYSYNWSGGGATSSLSVNPSSSSTYTLTVTDSKGCSATSQVTVTVNTNPIASAGTDQIICTGASATLTGNASAGIAPYSYTWSGGGTSISLTVNPSSSTTYTLTVTDNRGCSATSQVGVIVNTNPVASAGTHQDICVGTSATLTGSASGGTSPYNYTWLGGATTSSFTVSPTSNTTYSLTVTDSKGCSANSQVNVTVNANPSASAGANQSICVEASAILSGSASGGTAPYSYSWSGGGTTSSLTVNPASSTTYTLTVTDSKSCTATSQVMITVNPKPAVNAGADQTICPTLSTTLTATVSGGSSPYQFSWSNGATSSTQNISPTETSTYTLSVTDNNNCSATDQVVIQVTALDFTIDGPTVICAGEQITLSTTHAGTYAWSTGASTSSISHVPTSSTTYTLELTANGCTRAQSKAVQVNPLPTFTLPELTTACTGTSTTLAPQDLTPATGLTYQWMVPAGVTNPGNVASLTTNKAGQYQIKVTVDATGCNFNRVTTFRHIPRPVLYDPSLSLTCGNGGAQSLKLLMKASAAAFSPEENSPALLYLYRIKGNTSWQNSSALEVTLPSGSAQEYEVSVQYQNGLCAEDLPIKSIPVPPTPLSLPHQNNIGISPNQATDCFTSDGSINITSQLPASDFLEYALRNQQEVMIHNWQSSRTFNNLLPGTYSVGVRINPAKIGLSTCATTLGKIKFYPTTVGSTAMPSIQTLDKTDLTSCVLDNGAVEIKASFFGHALHYKVDELDWQASPIFEGLAKNGHTASVRPANGCESLVVSQAFTLNAAPLPAPLTVQNTPPAHCSQPNGSISISLPTALQSKDWLVSIDGGGTYIKNQWNWINLDRGTYHVSVAALDESCRQDYAQTISFDPPCEEICGDGLDNDFDGKVDCADEFCQASYGREITGKSFCRDDAKFIFTNLNNVDKIRKVGGDWGTQTAFLNLPAGPVAFEVRSTAGCIQLEKYNFNTPRILPAPTPDFYVNCNATHPGVLIFGNVVDHLVGYRKLGGAWTWSATEGEIILNNLEPGTYEVAASEGGDGSCMTISTKTIDIFPAGAPTLQSLDQYAPNTCSTNDGRIVILAKGYHVEYAIRPQGSSQALVWSSNNQFTQLAAGAYQVFARHSNLDERFCSQFNQVLSQLVTLNTPQITIAQVTHQGPTNACVNDPTLNGSITITASKPSGSTGKLVYSIDGGTTFVSNPVFTGLGPGNYTPAVAFEDHTCKTTGTVVNMTPVQAPAITSVVTTAPTACGQQTGKITINTAAVGSWKYSIDGGATFQTSKDFLNLKTLHNYSIVVATNDLNCRNNYGTVQIPKKADCVENCSDGIDNDGNGLADCDDPSCSNSTDCPAGVDRIVCPGSTITIGQTAPANPAYCYTWVPTTGLATPHQPSTTITPTQSGQYELIITDGNGQIVKRDKVNITVESLSPITIMASAPAYCGKPLTLSAPTGYTTYSWKDASNNTLGTTASIQVNQAGAYTLTATKSAGCQTSGNITVPTLELSVATIGASTLCPGAVVELRAQTTNISGLDLAYRWSNNATTSAISAGAGAYTLTLTEVKAGCQLTAAQTLTETSMPQLIVSADKPAVCQGQTTQLRAELSAYDNIESYTWTGPAGFSATGRVVASPALNASTAGEYHLTVAFTNGCSTSKSLTLTHLVPQQATVCNNGPICPGTELKLSATYGYTYQWTGPNGFVSSEQNPVLSSGAIGVYNVTLTDSNGCVSTHTTEVNQLPGSNN